MSRGPCVSFTNPNRGFKLYKGFERNLVPRSCRRDDDKTWSSKKEPLPTCHVTSNKLS